MSYELRDTAPSVRGPGTPSAILAVVIALVFVAMGPALFALPLFVYAGAMAVTSVVQSTVARVVWGLVAAAAGLVSLAFLAMFAFLMLVFANGGI